MSKRDLSGQLNSLTSKEVRDKSPLSGKKKKKKTTDKITVTNHEKLQNDDENDDDDPITDTPSSNNTRGDGLVNKVFRASQGQIVTQPPHNDTFVMTISKQYSTHK